MLGPRYEPEAAEDRWYAFWLEKDYFHGRPEAGKPPYSIVIPPPNVTGSLHMGHALNNTLQDILIRWKRMSGHAVCWMPGTDHAGIATQNVVERQLAAEGLSRGSLGREQFIKRVWGWKKESGGTIIRQLMRLGASCDWKRERFTMDEGLSKAGVELDLEAELAAAGVSGPGDDPPAAAGAKADLAIDDLVEAGYTLPTDEPGDDTPVWDIPLKQRDDAQAAEPADRTAWL